ncbi:S8 family peptidase [Microbacterium yannicii]|uniref:S8 family peptidase n=1 Tax=Microbacterium yannicii TaxID=671622 RepID=UPI000319CFA1|nr:S8 family serine peptidase [Microbacterium yannicii]
MSTLPPGDPAQGSAGDRRGWRERYDAARGAGVPLDPTSEPVEGVNAYPTAYAPDHLLVTSTEDVVSVLEALRPAAADFGWGIRLENLDRTPLDIDTATDRARRGRRDLDLPTIYRIQIFPQPSPEKDDQPVPPIDAWRLLQRARARSGKGLQGVSLDHVMSLDPFGHKTNPFGHKTNPFGHKTNPFGHKTNPVDSYGDPGSGGRQVVAYAGPPPVRNGVPAKAGRRPVVAVLDTGCGRHPWLPDDIVTRYPELDDRVIGADPNGDPEVTGDLAGPFDGMLDTSAGHGTFIAGIVRQVCPDADLISIRVADSEGNVLEGDFMLALRSLVKWMARPSKEGGRQIDVINLSLGYYHETPDDDLFDRTLAELLLAARRRGCAIVCSAGNDATDRPSFPAALWAWPGADYRFPDPRGAAPHVAVGALNPNRTVALFSNIGRWVTTFAPGAGVLSTMPPFDGGQLPAVRDNRGALCRETIDVDDFTGGFALWSGTSFAAPYVSAMLAREIGGALMSGKLTTPSERVAALRKAGKRVMAWLEEQRVYRS